MLRDRYDNDISTSSAAARDQYVTAVDGFLAGAGGIVAEFQKVTELDPDFALGHSGLARARMVWGDGAGARQAMVTARSKASGLPTQEAAHIDAMGMLVEGKMPAGYRAIRAHVAEYPRDVMLAQTCTSIYGLIGFSGQPGREAELLAYTSALAPHYGDDWWMLSMQAFSLCETGQVDPAQAMIDRSLELEPRNANAAHVCSHTLYEAGETETGITFLEDWLSDYEKAGILHGHLSWHVGLWALERRELDRLWKKVDADVAPGAAECPPLMVLTDTASILYRASLAGIPVEPERWQRLSAYAAERFPKPGLGWVDLHAALTHAMAGNEKALETIIAAPVGPSADLIGKIATAYRAIAAEDWDSALDHLTGVMADHARVGGSRAQRDLLEHTVLGVLVRQGKADEARRLIATRRPVVGGHSPVAGLDG
ncbi:MAG: tetratricopeptide repeat protein [Pseudomonadota bacterium]